LLRKIKRDFCSLLIASQDKKGFFVLFLLASQDKNGFFVLFLLASQDKKGFLFSFCFWAIAQKRKRESLKEYK
jgi:hypothetical protein